MPLIPIAFLQIRWKKETAPVGYWLVEIHSKAAVKMELMVVVCMYVTIKKFVIVLYVLFLVLY